MSEYTAGQVEAMALSMSRRLEDRAAKMLTDYATALRQQTTNPPEIGSKLVGQQGEYSFGSADDLANWLESLHATTDDGALTNGKWQPAQVAARAIRNMGAPAEQGGRVDALKNLPSMWRKIEQSSEPQTEFDKGYEQASYECADALEAALAQNAQGDEAPAAYCCPDDPYNSTAFAWPGTARVMSRHKVPLYTHAERARVPDGLRALVATWREAVLSASCLNKQDLRPFRFIKDVEALLATAPSQPEDAE